MAARQFQLDAETYVNADDNSREFQFDVETYFIEEVAAGITGALTGTIVSGGVTEAEIAAGGETLIITLTNDTWVAAGTGPIGSTADTQALIDGITASTTPANGWNNEVRDKEPVSIVTRNSNTQATLLFTTAASAYDISSNETVEVTLPASVLVTSGDAVVATPTFDITAAVSGVTIPVVMHNFRMRVVN